MMFQKTWRGICRVIAVLAAIFVITGLAQAQAHRAKTDKLAVKPEKTANQAQFEEYNALPENKKFRLLLQLINSGQQDLAEDLIKRQPLNGKHAKNRGLFLEGKILKARGDHKAAIKKFRKVLANDPKLTLVRAELAHSLFTIKEDKGAKHHLQLLSGAAPTPEAAEQFNNFIDAIDARRPWNFSAHIALAPSTNFNNGTSTSTVIVDGQEFEITGNAVARSGVGIRGGGNASYRFDLDDGLSLTAAGGVNFTEHEGADFDDLIVTQNLLLKKKLNDKTTVGIGGIGFQRFIGVDEVILGGGPQLQLFHRFSDKVTLSAKAQHLQLQYEISDFRDGSLTNLDFEVSRVLSTTAVIYGYAGFDYTDAESGFLDAAGGRIGAGLYKEFPYGLTFFGTVNGRIKDFEGIFPGLDEGRFDQRVDVNVAITKRDFELFGLAPRFEFSFIRNFSNTVFDDFETHGAQVTLTKKF